MFFCLIQLATDLAAGSRDEESFGAIRKERRDSRAFTIEQQVLGEALEAAY